VVDGKGVPMLRQVRLGRADGERIEVLSGVSAGERVALDPQAAARMPPEGR
jgi:multidrug efflux pump subunit AcrA (membrane-fusion protein)